MAATFLGGHAALVPVGQAISKRIQTLQVCAILEEQTASQGGANSEMVTVDTQEYFIVLYLSHLQPGADFDERGF